MMLTLAFSTIKKNLNGLISYLLSVDLPDEVRVIIINQLFQDGDNELNILPVSEIINDKIEVYHFNEKGISRSRNRAIEKCNTDYIWFLDDDVQLVENELMRLISHLKDFKYGSCIIKIGSLEDPSLFYKNYKMRNYGLVKNAISLLKVSSIEIICNISVIRKYKIKFDEGIGLGTQYPCCEENRFMLDIFKYSTVFNFDCTPVLHTTKTEHRLSSSEGHFRSRGTLAKQFNLFTRLALIVRWGLRKDANVSFLNRFFFLFSGRPNSAHTHIISPYESPAEGRGTRNIYYARIIGDNCNFVCTRFSHGRKKLLPAAEFLKNDDINIKLLPTIIYHDNLSIKRMIAHWCTALSVAWYLLTNTNRNDTVIVSSIPPEVLLMATLSQLFKRFNLSVDVRDIWPEAFPLSGLKGRFFQVYCNAIYSMAFKLTAKKFIHVAPSFKNWIDERVPSNKIIGNYFGYLGYDLSRWQSIQKKSYDWLQDDQLKLVYVGYLESQFDISDIIKYVVGNNKYELTIIGNGSKLDYYKSLANDSDNINFAGLLSPQDVVNVMSDKHIGILPITKTAQMPNKLFDYIGACIPVLCIGNSDSSEFVQSNEIGWGVNWGISNIASVLDNIDAKEISAKYDNLFALKDKYSKDYSYPKLVDFIMSNK